MKIVKKNISLTIVDNCPECQVETHVSMTTSIEDFKLNPSITFLCINNHHWKKELNLNDIINNL